MKALAAVRCVTQARMRMRTLSHAEHLISACVDNSVYYNAHRAAASGSVYLFDRVLQRMRLEAVDPDVEEAQIIDALYSAAENGHLPMLQYIHAIHPTPDAPMFFRFAARSGSLDLFKWAIANRSDGTCARRPPAECARGTLSCCFDSIYQVAMGYGHFDIARFLLEGYCVEDLRSAVAFASRFGDLETFQHLHATRPQELKKALNRHHLDAIAAGGHVEVFRFLNECQLFGRGFHIDHIDQTNLTRQQRLVEDEFLWDDMLSLACANEHVALVEYIQSSGLSTTPSDDIPFNAVNAKQFGVLKLEPYSGFLDDRDGNLTIALQTIIDDNQFEMFKWIWDRCDHEVIGTEAFDLASASLRFLLWFNNGHQEFAIWSPDIMDEAAARGDLETVQWLHANRPEGCTADAMECAAERGHLDVVKWLHENRSEGCSAHAMEEAAACGHLHVVKWLHENRTEGCTTRAMDLAAERGSLEVLKWLYTNRTEGYTANIIRRAVDGGQHIVVKWLLSLDPNIVTIEALNCAIVSGDIQMVSYLCDHIGDALARNSIATVAMNRASHFSVFHYLCNRYRDQLSEENILRMQRI